VTPERMLELFQGNPDNFAVQLADGQWVPTDRPLTVEELDAHLFARQTVGVYPLHGSLVRWGVADLDIEDRPALDLLFEAAKVLGVSDRAMLREHSGRKGFHLWIFFGEWVEAALVRRLLRGVIEASKVTHKVEVFPKQDKVDPNEVDAETGRPQLGNLVKLPFGLHRVSGKVAMPLDVTGPIEPLTAQELLAVLAPLPAVQPHSNGTGPVAAVEDGDGVIPEHERNNTLSKMAFAMRRAGMTVEEIEPVLLEINLNRCRPPLPEEEVRKTAQGKRRVAARDLSAIPGAPDRVRRVDADETHFYVNWPGLGELHVLGARVLKWPAVEDAFVNSFKMVPPINPSKQEWRDLMAKLLPFAEATQADPEETAAGQVREFLHQLNGEPDPYYLLAPGGVWHDVRNKCYAIRGAVLRFFMQRYLGTILDRSFTPSQLYEILREQLGVPRQTVRFTAEQLAWMRKEHQKTKIKIPETVGAYVIPEALVDGER
jgi:hypothetical protein